MIGVDISDEEAVGVAEFFELFKTPWERFVPGRPYDTVLCTGTPPEDVTAPLLLVFSSESLPIDELFGSGRASRQAGATLTIGNSTLPLYGKGRTFGNAENASATVDARIAGCPAGFRRALGNTTLLRLGFDLFREVQHLLSHGQPVAHGQNPTLDLHIEALRRWIVEHGVSLVEILPAPWRFKFAVCLTHDIDFIGLRQHRWDPTMWGFLYRSTLGAAARFLRRRITLRTLSRCWGSAATLPLAHLGWRSDAWVPFPWYLEAERGLPATYYLIPYKRRAGQRVTSRRAARRGTAYDITDIPDWVGHLRAAGAEIGVHGIDAWHDSELGQAELNRVIHACGATRAGVRMHWLLSDNNTPKVLEAAGYDYDSTAGYNEIPGYRAGTTQVYRPTGASLLELPLHIQDGALFFPGRMNLTEDKAWEVCQRMIAHVSSAGGVLTLLWHDRSHGPERYWGAFYLRLLGVLRQMPVWFATGRDVVDWFRTRRSIAFQRTARGIRACRPSGCPAHPFVIRIHHSADRSVVDIPWQGDGDADLSLLRTSSTGETRLASALAS